MKKGMLEILALTAMMGGGYGLPTAKEINEYDRKRERKIPPPLPSYLIKEIPKGHKTEMVFFELKHSLYLYRKQITITYGTLPAREKKIRKLTGELTAYLKSVPDNILEQRGEFIIEKVEQEVNALKLLKQ